MDDVVLLDVPNASCVVSGINNINSWLGLHGVDGRDVLSFTVTTTPGSPSRELHVTELVRKNGRAQIAEHSQVPVARRRTVRILDQSLPEVVLLV